MGDIHSLLRQKEEQLKLLTKQVEALRLTVAMMAEDQKLAGNNAPQQPIKQLEMICAVLADKGDPMHVSKIADAIKKKYGKRLKPAYITSLIYRPMRKGKLFYKAELVTGTFGLIEWKALPLQMPTIASMGS